MNHAQIIPTEAMMISSLFGLFKNTDTSNQIIIETVRAFREDTPPTQAELVQLNCPEHILHEFRQLLAGTRILGCSFYNPYIKQMQTIPTDISHLTSLHLQILARNEHLNVDGKMRVELYQGLLSSDQIARLRCMVKATTVSGVAYATHLGGYHGKARMALSKPEKTIVIDQSGLQWQDDFRNTGGMLFYPQHDEHDDLPQGYALWQQQMFQMMYGRERPSTPSDNTLDVFWNGLPGQLDLQLVINAIAVEFSQALDAAVHQGNVELNQNDAINFKFLRAGLGFFASGLSGNVIPLRIARLQGIELALHRIVNLSPAQRAVVLGKVKCIELPYSNNSPHTDDVLARIQALVEELGLIWGGAPETAPFCPNNDGYINATTNCGDPHAMIGNEGTQTSVDASMSCNANLNNHNAAFNQAMQLRVSPEFVFSMDSRSKVKTNNP